jgi:hypothetical protein
MRLGVGFGFDSVWNRRAGLRWYKKNSSFTDKLKAAFYNHL